MEGAVFLKGASWKAISIALVYPLGEIIGIVETVAGAGQDLSSDVAGILCNWNAHHLCTNA